MVIQSLLLWWMVCTKFISRGTRGGFQKLDLDLEPGRSMF